MNDVPLKAQSAHWQSTAEHVDHFHREVHIRRAGMQGYPQVGTTCEGKENTTAHSQCLVRCSCQPVVKRDEGRGSDSPNKIG